MKQGNGRRLLRVLALTVLFAVLYFWLSRSGFFWISFVYLGAGAGLALYYVIYNKGFTRKGLTASMLPDTMSIAEKQELIEDGKRRLKRSAWALTFLIPIILTFLMDFLYIFLLPNFEELFR